MAFIASSCAKDCTAHLAHSHSGGVQEFSHAVHGIVFLPAAKSSGSFVLPLGVFLEMTKCFLIVLDNPFLERFGESERRLATRVSYRAVSGNSLLKHPQ
jgi:hypothetical protein